MGPISRLPSISCVPNALYMFLSSVLQVFTNSLRGIKNGRHSVYLPRGNRCVKIQNTGCWWVPGACADGALHMDLEEQELLIAKGRQTRAKRGLPDKGTLRLKA